MKLVQALLILTTLNVSLASENTLEIETSKALKSKNLRNNARQLQERPCDVLLKLTEYEEEGSRSTLECSVSNDRILPMIDLPEETAKELEQEISMGHHPTFFARGAQMTENGIEIPIGASPIIGRHEETNTGRRLATGTKTFLAVRVIASDESTTSSETDISDSVYGTNGDPVNLKSQYEACSYGKITVEPANLTTSTGVTVSNGVYTVNINMNVNGVDDGSVRNAVTSQLTTDLGSLTSQFDYVMLCLPPGTNGGWIAYAYINWYLSVYNDNWCNYVSAQMHEIGHNVGLAHAGESATYDDQSGMMGYSYSSSDAPKMCFNAAKNAQLGWYADKLISIDINDNWSGELVGLSDYGNAGFGQNVILKITGNIDGNDYYVSLNRKSGINSGTVEGGNQVLVHKRTSGDGYATSTLLSKLSAGGNYAGIGKTLTVNSINLSANPPYALITYGTVSPPTPPPTSLPTSPPTPPPTSPPTSPPPTDSPTTAAPTVSPTESPTGAPTTAAPTNLPTTKAPTNIPTSAAPTTPPPTSLPTTFAPTSSPTNYPTNVPTTKVPTNFPTIAPPTSTWTRITYDDFENGWGSYADGGSDAFRYTKGTNAHQGQAAIRIRDNSGQSSSFYHKANQDVSDYNKLRVTFWFIARSMENNEQFELKYSTNGGTNYQNAATWTKGADSINNGTFTNGKFYPVEAVINSSNFNNIKLRFECVASGNNDKIFIDEIELAGSL